MTETLLARVLYTETGRIDWPVVRVEDGLIASVEAGGPNGACMGNAAGEALTAAFFDVHVHGAVGQDFMAASGAEIGAVGRFLASRGVGHYLATTVTAPVEDTLRALEVLAGVIEAGAEDGAAKPVGVHLEGPFVSHAKRGVHPAACLQRPDVGLFARFQEAARGQIKLLTVAPEVPGALELIAYATSIGVRVSLGHSDATAAEATAGIAAGAVSATHTFNAMRALGHREVGILGVVLDREDLYAELICDGVHVDPSMVRLWLKAKGVERAMLVTDGMSATGMPEGEYELGGMRVTVKGGVCLVGETLAGSVLTMDKAVENLRRFTGSELGAAVRLAAQNPARMMGMSEVVGLGVGSPADFNVYGEDGVRVGSYLRGVRVAG